MTSSEIEIHEPQEATDGPATIAPRGRAALAGILAAAFALGIGELLAGLSSRIPSLVVAVGDAVIDNVPGSIERWAIETLGENDKPALIIGVVVISLLIGAFTGIAASRRFRSGVSVFALFAIIGGLAGSLDDQRSAWAGWLSAFLAATGGLLMLRFLLRAARNTNKAATYDELSTRADRRSFVGAASAAAAVGVAAPVIGTALRSRQTAGVEADRDEIAAVLNSNEPTEPSTEPEPEVESSLAAVDNLDDIEGITPLVVPSDEFYRIDAALSVPKLDVDTWSMKITGMVDTELEFTFDDLLDMDPVEEYVTMSCVSNEVGGDLVGNAKWLGVPLKKLLDKAGVQPGATQIVGRSVDGWTGGFPTEYLDDPDRVALVALAMNGEPLPLEHGFPVRLVIAGLYGYVSATKWLKEVELTTLEDFDGYWITRGWSKLGPVKTQSRIDVPRPNSRLDAGTQALAGVAWAPDRGVAKVEVQVSTLVDGQLGVEGPWLEAQLSTDLSNNAWRQWHLPWEAEPGDWAIRVRATDGEGVTQTEQRSAPAPSGATGWHGLGVRVT